MRESTARTTLVAALLVYVFAQSFVGRANLRDSTFDGCLRATAQRAADAAGWRMEQRKAVDPVAARAYGATALVNEKLTARTPAGRRRFCELAFPEVKPYP